MIWIIFIVDLLPQISEGIGVGSTCEISPAEFGKNVNVTVNFSEDLSKKPKVDFSLAHRKHNSSVVLQVLRCYFYYGVVECDEKSCCTADKRITDVLHVVIYNVSEQYVGLLWGLVVPDDFSIQKPCNFTIKVPVCNIDMNITNSYINCTSKPVTVGHSCTVICINTYFGNQASMKHECIEKERWSPSINPNQCNEVQTWKRGYLYFILGILFPIAVVVFVVIRKRLTQMGIHDDETQLFLEIEEEEKRNVAEVKNILENRDSDNQQTNDETQHFLKIVADVQMKAEEWIPLLKPCIRGQTGTVTNPPVEGTDVIASDESCLVCQKGGVDFVGRLLRKGVNLSEDDGKILLYVSCYNGHTDVVKDLLQNGASVNKAKIDGTTPLHAACLSGHTDLIQLLLENGAETNKRNKDRNTPLHYACYKGHVDVVKELLGKGAKVNTANQDEDRTPLCVVILNRNTIVAKVNAMNNKGATPLYAACLNGNTDVVKLLVENNANVNAMENNRVTPLHAACLNGNTKVVKILLEKNAKVNATKNDGDSPLHRACRFAHTKVVKHLLNNKNVNVNVSNRNGQTPLHFACSYGNCDMVRALLEKGADVNAAQCGDTPLQTACSNGNTEMVNALLEYKANINATGKDGGTPLFHACYKGHRDIVQILLEKGADVESERRDGQTPLHVLCSHNYPDLVMAFIEKGAKVNVQRKDGGTPLHLACYMGYTDVIKVLIDNDANVNAINHEETTPLHFTCYKGHTDVVKVLIQNRANVNAINHDGMSPLHFACDNRHTDVVNILIINYANVNIKNKKGMSPLQSARLKKNESLVNVLLENGAKESISGSDGETIRYSECHQEHPEPEEVDKLLEEVMDETNRNETTTCAN